MKNVFLFSGQGSQFYQMGLELYQNHTVFQTHHMDKVAAHFRKAFDG